VSKVCHDDGQWLLVSLVQTGIAVSLVQTEIAVLRNHHVVSAVEWLPGSTMLNHWPAPKVDRRLHLLTAARPPRLLYPGLHQCLLQVVGIFVALNNMSCDFL
jgi:hypothetical protein